MRHRTYFVDGIGRKGTRRYQSRAPEPPRDAQQVESERGVEGRASGELEGQAQPRHALNLSLDECATKAVLSVASMLGLGVPPHEREQDAGVANDNAALPGDLAQPAVGGVQPPRHDRRDPRRTTRCT